MNQRYYYPELGSDVPPPGWTAVVRFAGDTRPFEAAIDSAALHTEPPPRWALDIFEIAKAAYLVDNMVQRRHMPDRWTRLLELSIPVTEPGNWPAPTLQQLLGLLTSDTWRIHLRQRHSAATIFSPNTPMDLGVPSRSPRSVALFSGGLDSLSYAAQTDPTDQPVALVSHWNHNKLRAVQKVLIDEALRKRGVEFLPHQFSVMRIGSKSKTKLPNELTTRSRAFLFLAAGVVVAASYGIPTVQVPENGFLSLNPPLTPGRPGACTTRSTHPLTLKLFNELLATAQVNIRVVNPYQYLTKGEVCRQAWYAGLTPTALAQSVTCSAPARRQHQNCGHCFPCLVRRAGLHHAMRRSGGDPTTYHEQPPWTRGELTNDLISPGKPERLADFAAMLRWLATEFTMRDITAVASLPDDLDLRAAYEVVRRSRKELVAMLEHEMCPRTKTALGWSPKP